MICIGQTIHAINHGNILLMENKHSKWFTVMQPERLKCTPKMHLNTFGGRALSGPAGELSATPDPYSHNEGPTSNEGGGYGGWRGKGMGGREKRGMEGR